MMLRLAAVGLIWALLIGCTKAVILFPYGAGNGDTSYGPSDDGYVNFNLQYAPLHFYGQDYTNLYMHNNGFVSVGGVVYGYTPPPLESTTHPVIAPYWGDVYTRISGALYYRESCESGLLAIANDVVNTITDNFQAESLLIVTWDNVGYYSSSDKTNTFQMVIASGGGRSFIIFLYKRLEWTTGNASGGSGGLGGTEARVGLGAGDGVRHFTVAISNTPAAILSLTDTSNVGTPGVLVLTGDPPGQQNSQVNVAQEKPMVAYNRGNVVQEKPMVAYNRGNVVQEKPMVTYNRGNVAQLPAEKPMVTYNQDSAKPMASKSSAELEELERQLFRQ